jgi:hypothetical protein
MTRDKTVSTADTSQSSLLVSAMILLRSPIRLFPLIIIYPVLARHLAFVVNSTFLLPHRILLERLFSNRLSLLLLCPVLPI